VITWTLNGIVLLPAFSRKFYDWIAFSSSALITSENTNMSGAAKRLIPLFDRVLIKKAEIVTKTKGGIVIPEKAQAKVLKGTVVAVGPGSRNNVRYLVVTWSREY
jgi:hypothetical protein